MLKVNYEELSQFQQLVLAFSGGVDSHVLLHLLSQDKIIKKKLSAIYINHGLSDKSIKWQIHCEQVCLDLAVKFKAIDISDKLFSRVNFEDKARNLRYEALGLEVRDKNSALLTAHHQDDQAETFLLQLFRGAGLNGLSAMARIKNFYNAKLIRPLLNYTRDEIINYAKLHNLLWIDDPSNLDISFKRNFLRHEVMPKIEQNWQGVSKTISRAAKHCAMHQKQLSDLVDLALPNLINQDNEFDLSKIKELDFSLQQVLVRHWLIKLKLKLPNEKKLQELISQVISAKPDKNPILDLGAYKIARYQNFLYIIFPTVEFDRSQIIDWDINYDLELPGNLGILQLKDQTLLSKEVKYTVRFRQDGEKIELNGIRHDLKKLMQQWSIPPWNRSKIPLIFANDELFCVASYTHEAAIIVTSF